MVKVIFTDGSEMNFHGIEYSHNAEHREFVVVQPGSNHRIFIPDRNVKVCGVWDNVKNEFE